MYRSLQACRAIAAILVVLFHLGGALSAEKYFGIPWLYTPFSFGDAGVEFFFVLSGFIIFNAHKNDISRPQKLLAYLKKRAIRIYPTYWIIFFAVYFAALASPSLRSTVPHDIALIIKSLILVPLDKDVVGGTGAPVLIVAWTLQYEVLFYVFFALMILNRYLAAVAGLLVAGACVYCYAASSCSYPLAFVYSDYVWLFAMGMAISAVQGAAQSAINPSLIAIIGILGFVCIAADEVTQLNVLTPNKTLWYGFASSLIVFGFTRTEAQGVVIGGQKWLQLLGDSSYALYLLHFPLISILCKLSNYVGLTRYGLMGALIAYCIILGACLFCAVCFHLFIEKRLRPTAA